MWQQKLDQTFWAVLLSTQLLWQTGEGKCSRDDSLINVMMLNDKEFLGTADNVQPAVDLGLRKVREDLKGKSTVLQHSSIQSVCRVSLGYCQYHLKQSYTL